MIAGVRCCVSRQIMKVHQSHLLCRMWSIWIFTVPALRARDCSAAEKEVLNYLFLLIPVMNVTLPFVWKSFPFIFSADVAAMAALYAWKVGLPKTGEA